MSTLDEQEFQTEYARLVFSLLPGDNLEEKQRKSAQFVRSMGRMINGQPVARAKLIELEQFLAALASACTDRALTSTGCIDIAI